MNTEPRNRFCGYVRVSTDEQARHGVSLDVQRAKLVSYAAAMDLELVEVFADEGASAKNLKRPGIQAALAAIHEGRADGLLVCKLDRLTRSLMDLNHLVKQHFSEAAGKSLVSMGESINTRTASGRMVLNLLGTVAEWERETIGERTREGLAFLKASGVRLGGSGLGWDHGPMIEEDQRRAIVANPTELALLARIRKFRASGCTLQWIADKMNTEGEPTKRGGKWYPSTIAYLCKNLEPAAEIVEVFGESRIRQRIRQGVKVSRSMPTTRKLVLQ
jgi:DNA invertase Pin-like site-specific DNA recombinase